MNPSTCSAAWRTLSRHLIAMVVMTIAAHEALALDPHRSITQYVRTTWEDRLPHNTVRAVLQSRDGFIWIGTYEGLARFDGADFTVFDTRNSAMTTSAISALAEDSHGTLWIGTAGGGVYRYDGRDMQPIGMGGLGVMVSAITIDSDDTVWVATRRGLGRLRAGRFEILPGAPSALIWSMAATAPGEIWIGTEGGGLVRFAREVFTTYTTEQGLSSNVIYTLARRRAGGLWLGTSAGVDIVEANGAIHPGIPAGSLVSGTPAFALLEDSDGNLWIGGGKPGLCRLSNGSVRCERVDNDATDLIRTFSEDRERNLWIGGTHRGIWQLRDGMLTTTTGERSTNHVRTVVADAAGNIFAGTDGSGVNVIRDGMLEPIPENELLPSRFIRTLYVEPAGGLWVGTLEGLARVKDGRVRSFRATDGLTSDIVYALMPARDASLWVATSAGINRIVGDRIETVPFRGDVRALQQDGTGRVWVGRRDGLSCIEPDGRTTDCGAPVSLKTSTIFSFLSEPDGSMWIGTNHGLTRVRGKDFKTYGAREGLFDQNVFEILEDERAVFWMSSNRGIWSIPRADFDAYDRREIVALRSTAFGRSDGMASAQCNGGSQPAGWKTADGKLWFPTAKGVVTVDPARLRTNKLAPKAVVLNVVVDGRTISPQSYRSIPPDADHLEFHYSGLSFIAPEKVRFRFKLEGSDREWIEAGPRRVAYYTNLPKGDLRFKVIAANSDGVWSSTPTSIDLTLQPHYYETVWFRVLALALALSLIFGATRLWVRQQRRRERHLLHLVDERTEALRRANAALERLAAVDGLTHIPNRRSLDERLDALWNEHLRRRSPLAAIICDVDEFKKFNDAGGHLAGDEALVAVAQAIQATLKRATDFAARYGGEEFVILLSDTTLEQARVVGEQLLASVRDLAIPHPNSIAPVVTLSAGVASVVPQTTMTAEDLLSAADDALYRAKAEGRNRIRVGTVIDDPSRMSIVR